MPQMTKKGARSVSSALDNIASLMEKDWQSLGLPQHIANDMALRCDMLSDTIEKHAGLKRAEFNADEIGKEKSGPLEDEPDEPYMSGEFSQQENRELRERQEGGDLGATPNEDQQSPTPGVQAALQELTAATEGLDHPQVERALRLALDVAKTAKKAEEEEVEEEEVEEEPTSSKKAHGFDLSA